MAGRGPRTQNTQTKLDKYAYGKDFPPLPEGRNSSGKAADGDGSKKVTLEDIMAALTSVQATVGSISTDVSLVRADFQKMTARVTEVEQVTKTLVTDTVALQKAVSRLENDNKLLTERLDDQEGCSRRNNVRTLGIPENEGAPAMDLYVEDLIKTRLQPKGLSNFFSVERAHRVPGGKSKPGAPPRPVLARLFNFRDRDY